MQTYKVLDTQTGKTTEIRADQLGGYGLQPPQASSPQPSMQPQMQDQPQSQTPKYITGHSLEEHTQALQRARQAGNKAAEKQISEDLAREYSYQKDTGAIDKAQKDTVKQRDAKDAKNDSLQKAQALLDVIDQGKKGTLKGKDYEAALNSLSSSYTASKAFGEGGKNLTGTELSVLTGQIPVIEKHTGTWIDKVVASAQGREVPQTGKVVDSPDQLERKMKIAIATLKGEKIDPKLFQSVGNKQDAPKQDFIGGLANNAGQDAKDMLNGILNIPANARKTGKRAAAGDQQARLDASAPGMIMNIGKGLVQELNDATGHPLEGGDVVSRILDRAYKKPVTTGLDVLPFLSEGKAAIVGRAGSEAEAADIAANAGKTNPLKTILSNKGKNLTENVRSIDVGPNVSGPQKEALINQTFDKYGIKGTPEQQYRQLQPTMSKISDNIQKVLDNNPKTVPLDNIVKDFDTNLNREGIYRTSQMSRDVAQKEARSYIKDLYSSAHDTKDGVVPNDISTSDLFDLKKRINQDFKSVKKKIDTGSSLSDRDKVISVARQTVDDIISEYHPEVKEMTLDQSRIFDGVDSIYNQARNGKGGIPINLGVTKMKVGQQAIQGGKDALGRILRGGDKTAGQSAQFK